MTEAVEAIMQAALALNDGDIDSFYEFVADDCTLVSPAGEMRGRQAILDGDRAILPLLDPHWRRLEHAPIVSGNSFAFWGVFGGTVKATGKSFETDICQVMHLRDGKIVRWETYVDLSKTADAWVPDQ